MEIKTERLLIRKIAADDWRGIKKIWDDFRGSEYAVYDLPHKSDEEEVRAQVRDWEKANKEGKYLFFSVCLGGELIGYIEFRDTGHSYDSGYCFHSDYHRKGYARESYRAMIPFFRNMGVKRLTAGTALDNIPSVRLLHSLGFQQIGTEKVSFYKDELGNDIYFDGGIFEFNVE